MSDSSLEEFMLGMASQLAEREDAVLCSDVRDKLFGPNEFSRRDLGALNVMRGRDNGLSDYNTVVDEWADNEIQRKYGDWLCLWCVLDQNIFRIAPDRKIPRH